MVAIGVDQFVRLAFTPSGTIDDFIRRLHVPFWAERDYLRTYLESGNSYDIGKYIVSVVGTEIINQINFRDVSWFFRIIKLNK